MQMKWLWACVVFAMSGLVGGTAFAQTIATSAALRVVTSSGEGPVLPLIDEDVDVVIDQQHATTKLRHMYHNNIGRRVEGRFELRAGGGSMVHRFAYWNGEQKIVGEVFDKGLATQLYESTVQKQRDPGLLTQTNEGTFAFRIFPIANDEHKRVEIEVDQWLTRTGETVEYRVPVQRGDADVRIEIIDDRSIGSIVSSSHNLKVQRSNGRVVVTSDGVRGTRSELVLRYQLLDKPWSLSAAMHRDADHDGYLMLSLPAPQVKKQIAKDVTLVIDRSGSMLGEPMKQAKSAALAVLKKLDKGDRFNVLAFDSAVDAVFNTPKPVGNKSILKAERFVERLDEGGGTDIARALTRAFSKQNHDQRPKTVIFLTDGKSDSKAALEAAKSENKDVRVFTVGLGPKVDKPFLARLASEKRGRFTFVESAATLPTRMSKLYDTISSPALVGVELAIEGTDASLYRVYPTRLPDVFNGDELRISSRVQGKGQVKIIVTGTTADGPITIEHALDIPATASRRWVGRLWARSRVDHLLEEMALSGESSELVAETKELGLAYNLMTPYTAFLAIPESELDATGQKLLSAMRGQREEALAFNPDAAALAGASPEMVDEPLPSPSAAPEDMAFAGRGGCASCSVGADRPDGADIAVWAWLALALGMAGRRRR